MMLILGTYPTARNGEDNTDVSCIEKIFEMSENSVSRPMIVTEYPSLLVLTKMRILPT